MARKPKSFSSSRAIAVIPFWPSLRRALIRPWGYLSLILVVQGCAYSSYTTPLNPPIERQALSVTYTSAFNRPPSGMHTASIGDELFVISRYLIGEREEVRLHAPARLHSFPSDAKWMGTYRYDDGGGDQLVVFTSPSYYNGDVGVILNTKDEVATRRPLVQVAGKRTGRRWSLIGTGKFFVASERLTEAWGVRYSGQRGTAYVFEIIDKHGASVTQIIQSVHVPETEFLRGFTIKGVLVTGLAKDNRGVIRYSIKDVRVD